MHISCPVIQVQAPCKEIHGHDIDPGFALSYGWVKRKKVGHRTSQVKNKGNIKSAELSGIRSPSTDLNNS